MVSPEALMKIPKFRRLQEGPETLPIVANHLHRDRRNAALLTDQNSNSTFRRKSVAITLSKREIGLIYTLLRNTNDGLLETSPANASNGTTDAEFPKNVRLNKLIAANLRQKLQGELTEKS